MRVRQIIVVVVAVAIAAWSFHDAALAIWLSAESAGPPAVVRNDPRVQLSTLEVDFLPDGVPAPNKAGHIADLARTVLLSAPIEVSALRDLALASQQLGDPAASGRFALAEKISRRDLPTQNALLRVAAQNGQYGAAIQHLDRILTVSPETESQFVEALMALVGDPVGRSTLAGYSARPWFAVVAAQAIVLVDDPRNTADLLLSAHGMRSVDAQPLGPELLKHLVLHRDYTEARDFAVRFIGAEPAALDDFRLNPTTADPQWTPLSWLLTSNVNITPHFTNDGTLQTDVKSGASAVVIERVTLRSPGIYELEQEVKANEAAKYLRLQWEVSCQNPNGSWGAPIWRQPVPLGVQPTRYSSRVEVPADCPAQRWQLAAAVDETQLTPTFWLNHLTLSGSSPHSDKGASGG